MTLPPSSSPRPPPPLAAIALVKPPRSPTPSRLHGHPSTSASFSLDLDSTSSNPSDTEWWKWHTPIKDDARNGIEWRPPRKLSKASKEDWKRHMIGKWKLGESLGKGSCGRVWIARNVDTGEYSAVKKIKRMSHNHKIAEIIQREIVVQKLVEHTHVLKLLDVFETPVHLYLVTEFCSHGELYQYISNRTLSTPVIKRFFSQLVSALAHLHFLSISHRDVKFENLLLVEDTDGELSIKLADLGLAAFQPPGSLLFTSCGSPHYAAPEVVAGHEYDGPPADIWSAGVVLFAMAARRLPFDHESVPFLLLAIKSGIYDIPATVQGDARDLIERMLTVDAKKRITIEEVIVHPFLDGVRPQSGDWGQLPFPLCQGIGVELPRCIIELEPDLIENLTIVFRGNLTHEQISEMVMSESAPKLFYIILRNFKNRRHDHTSGEVTSTAETSRSASRLHSLDTFLRRARSLPPPTPPPTSPLPPTPTTSLPCKSLSNSIDESHFLGRDNPTLAPRLARAPARVRTISKATSSVPSPSSLPLSDTFDITGKHNWSSTVLEHRMTLSSRLKTLFSTRGPAKDEDDEPVCSPAISSPTTPASINFQLQATPSTVKKSTAYESLARVIVNLRDKPPSAMAENASTEGIPQEPITVPVTHHRHHLGWDRSRFLDGPKRRHEFVDPSSDEENVPLSALKGSTPSSPVTGARRPSPTKRRPTPLSLFSPNNKVSSSSVENPEAPSNSVERPRAGPIKPFHVDPFLSPEIATSPFSLNTSFNAFSDIDVSLQAEINTLREKLVAKEEEIMVLREEQQRLQQTSKPAPAKLLAGSAGIVQLISLLKAHETLAPVSLQRKAHHGLEELLAWTAEADSKGILEMTARLSLEEEEVSGEDVINRWLRLVVREGVAG